VLRAALYTIGGCCLAAGLLPILIVHYWGTIGLVLFGLVLLGGLLVERWRYQDLSGARPGPDWQATGERFVDPESGKLVAVYYHPKTGERRYIAV